MTKTNKKEYGILLVMIGMTLVGKFLGLFREMLMAAKYGVTLQTDAFLAAARVPTYLFDLALSAAVVSTFIPTFNQVMKKEGKAKAYVYANQFISMGMVVSLVVMALLLVFPQVIVKLVSPGLNLDTLDYAATLTRMMSPVIIFAFITYTFVGLLQSFEHFNVAAMISVFSNLVVIIYMVFFMSIYGFKGLAIAVTIGWILQALVQVPVMKKEGYGFRFNFNWRSKAMKRTLKMSLPTLLITWGQPLSAIISNAFASYFIGGVTMMDYAMKVFIIVTGVIVYSITNYIFPKLSSLYDKDDLMPFKTMAERTLLFFLYFALPVTLLLAYFSQEVIVVLFQRGAFTGVQAQEVGVLLRGLSYGLIGTGIREILNRVYFAFGDTKTPLRITVISLLINVSLGLAMSRLWGLKGLAYAVSLTVIITSLYQLFNAVKKSTIVLSKTGVLALVKTLLVDLALMAIVIGINIEIKGHILVKVFQLSAVGLVFMVLHVVILKGLKVNVPHIQAKEESHEINISD